MLPLFSLPSVRRGWPNLKLHSHYSPSLSHAIKLVYYSAMPPLSSPPCLFNLYIFVNMHSNIYMPTYLFCIFPNWLIWTDFAKKLPDLLFQICIFIGDFELPIWRLPRFCCQHLEDLLTQHSLSLICPSVPKMSYNKIVVAFSMH